jgi:hypothetical protein
VLGDVVDAHDVRTGHLAREQQFIAEALEGFGPAGELGPQQLDGDLDVERQVARAIDHAHTADAEQFLDAEPPRDHFADAQFVRDDQTGHRGLGVDAGQSCREVAHRLTIAQNPGY